MLRKPMGIASRAVYLQSPPVRDEAYRRWIRSFPCVVCNRRYGIEAAHTGPHGMSQKAPDSSCIPVCKEHHRELHRGVGAFQERHLIDIPNLVEQFNATWEERTKAA